ncbi:MAG: 4'-phosphopantetheinyl transferase superfamily protein [Acidobacteria bacterium]|nr:4'-phosphopantetheinyl transferase superfamily protein [Acidobacteriota bacterium]
MRQPTSWAAAPLRPAPPAAEVHVWRAPLVQGPAALGALAETLSPDEWRRAERFHFRRDRESFVAARGALRDILGRYLGVRPELIRFTQNEFGKPALGGAEAGGPLRFNLSHAHETALVAVACGREVGVDVEFVREDCAGLDIAERFFSGGEVAALRGLPPGQRTRAFFDCWTRKEAYIKARGEGLSMPLKKFAVSLAPGEPAALLWAEDDPLEVSRWSLAELDPGPGYVGALASEGAQAGHQCWQWQARRG